MTRPKLKQYMKHLADNLAALNESVFGGAGAGAQLDGALPLRSELFSAMQMAAHGKVLAASHHLGRQGGPDLLLARLADNNTPAKSHDLNLVAERDGRLCGSSGLHMTPVLRRRHVAHLGISVSGPAQGEGVGSALMAAMCDYADQWAQILRIELTVFCDNERAIGLYRKFGFVHEGTHRAYAMRHGAYCDVFSMARLHPRPPGLPA